MTALPIDTTTYVTKAANASMTVRGGLMASRASTVSVTPRSVRAHGQSFEPLYACWDRGCKAVSGAGCRHAP
jgi:hypothetical protein